MPTPSEIQTCIDNLDSSSQPIDFTVLAAETSNANTGISFSVATVDDLPDLETTSIGTGQIFFVESIGVPVISTENAWKGLDGRLLRRDFVATPLFTWGCNGQAQLGDGSSISQCSPVREFCFATNWCQASITARTFAIKTDGTLWAWGQDTNGCGQLGTGCVGSSCSPVREFCSATNWCQVSAGGSRATAIKTSGEIWSWGSGLYGCLGNGTTVPSFSPVRELCSATNWCQVSDGRAIKTSGELWGWGINHRGQIGDGTTTNRCSPVRERCSATDWCQVSSSFDAAAAIKTSGELWVWGAGDCGSLGDGANTPRCSPVREFCSATDWCRVSVGRCNIAAIKTSGELWTWGKGYCGARGDGIATNRCSPVREFCSATDWCAVAVGGYHTLAIKTSSELWSWGRNVCGRLGDGTTVSRCSPVREFCSATDWCQVSASWYSSTVAIRSKL